MIYERAIEQTNRTVISQSLLSEPSASAVRPLNDDDDDGGGGGDALTPLQNARHVFLPRGLRGREGGREGGNREIFIAAYQP